MVSSRRKGQLSRSLLSHLDDFHWDIIIGNATGDRQENVVVNEGKFDQEYIVLNTRSTLTVN